MVGLPGVGKGLAWCRRRCYESAPEKESEMEYLICLVIAASIIAGFGYWLDRPRRPK